MLVYTMGNRDIEYADMRGSRGKVEGDGKQ